MYTVWYDLYKTPGACFNIKLCLDLLCNNLGDAEDLEAVEWQNTYLERDSMPYFTIAENISFNTNNILE